METELRVGLSAAAIVAIVCNSVVAVLILILFIILYKACKVPSCPDKTSDNLPVLEKQSEHKYLVTAA
uniref:Uncharacterized protein n=1 Tax=Denticeps clupeoides TaxID=299321 RepID=A0AAY4CQR3_9TELE